MFSSYKEVGLCLKKYENIMVAVDGSHEAELAFEKGLTFLFRNGSKLTIAHVIDTRALKASQLLMLRSTKNCKKKQMNCSKATRNAEKSAFKML